MSDSPYFDNPAPQYVELIDGRMVLRDAEAWRAECLARWVLTLKPLSHRQAWLFEYEKQHGPAEANKLKNGMSAIWEKRQEAIG